VSRYDAVVVGAGHNGLTCACYLARAGKKVKVLERRARVGGAAVTEEFHPGFRNSVAAYTVSLLQPKVMRELRLAEHGLRIVERPISNFLPLDGGYLMVGGGLDATRREFSKYSARDALRLTAYWERLNRVGDVLREMALETPPNAGGGWRDALAAVRGLRRLRALDMTARRSRRRSASTPSSAPTQARTSPGQHTCCCITASARSTGGAASGAMRLAGWGRSARRSPPRPGAWA